MKKLNSVLLIDDDKATNFINKMLIKKAAMTDHIETVLNGQQALDYLTNNRDYQTSKGIYPQPTLILLDINMPVMDGWQFAEAFSKLEENQKGNTIIIMLSSSFNPDDRAKATQHSVISGFQNKPLNMESLLCMMNNFFPEHLD